MRASGTAPLLHPTLICYCLACTKGFELSITDIPGITTVLLKRQLSYFSCVQYLACLICNGAHCPHAQCITTTSIVFQAQLGKRKPAQIFLKLNICRSLLIFDKRRPSCPHQYRAKTITCKQYWKVKSIDFPCIRQTPNCLELVCTA